MAIMRGIPIGTVGDHVGRFALWLHCRCGHRKRFDTETLALRLGRHFPNWRLATQAQCVQCGGRGADITIEPICVHGYGAIPPASRS